MHIIAVSQSVGVERSAVNLAFVRRRLVRLRTIALDKLRAPSACPSIASVRLRSIGPRRAFTFQLVPPRSRIRRRWSVWLFRRRRISRLLYEG
jgi:hypothetical protein